MSNYKNMLDSQLQTKKNLTMFGNMTDVEKKLNKQDLHAYKNFD